MVASGPMSPAPPAPPIAFDPLPYQERLDARALDGIDLVVIHCTELPDLPMARRFGEEVLYETSLTGNSGHFYIDRDGSVHQYVALERIAHHVRGHNTRAVGIELVNRGRYPDWLMASHQAMDEAYTQAQIDALIALLRWLEVELPSLRSIALRCARSQGTRTWTRRKSARPTTPRCWCDASAIRVRCSRGSG